MPLLPPPLISPLSPSHIFRHSALWATPHATAPSPPFLVPFFRIFQPSVCRAWLRRGAGETLRPTPPLLPHPLLLPSSLDGILVLPEFIPQNHALDTPFLFQDYSGDPLVHDEAYRLKLLTKLTQVGLAIEDACGGQPQDIEGAIAADGESVHVVQTRPQVLSQTAAGY